MQCLSLIVFLSIVVGYFCEEYVVDTLTGAVTIPKSCLHVCKQGACQYENCESTQCPGGACHFIDCKNPSCAGGACKFERCVGASCNGGSCSFINPSETLKPGYCNGGGCNIEGRAHPDLHSYLTI